MSFGLTAEIPPERPAQVLLPKGFQACGPGVETGKVLFQSDNFGLFAHLLDSECHVLVRVQALFAQRCLHLATPQEVIRHPLINGTFHFDQDHPTTGLGFVLHRLGGEVDVSFEVEQRVIDPTVFPDHVGLEFIGVSTTDGGKVTSDQSFDVRRGRGKARLGKERDTEQECEKEAEERF